MLISRLSRCPYNDRYYAYFQEPCQTDRHKEQEQQRLLHIFRLILTKHQDADKELRDAMDSSPNIPEQPLQFFSCANFVGSLCICHRGDDVMNCHCGLDHENFSYVSNGGINFDKLNAIIKCLELGECPHLAKAIEHPLMRKATAYNAEVRLVDAAAVVSNIPVLMRLLSYHSHVSRIIWPNNRIMTTCRLAVMHNQLSSFKAIYSNRCVESIALPDLISLLVIYDKPKYLEIILKTKGYKCFKQLAIESIDIAAMLGNKECLSVLNKNGIRYVPREDNVRIFINFMKNWTTKHSFLDFLDVLYFNPVFATSKIARKSVLKSAIKIDLKGCYSTMYMSKYRGLISVLLLDGGYNIRMDEAVLSSYESLLEVESPSSEHENAVRERLLCRIKKELFSPKPLQFSCRDVLRRTFTGKKLHVYMTVSNVPVTIKGFIMLQESHYNPMFLNSQ